MRIVYEEPRGRGWDPVTHMVRLAASLFDAELVLVNRNRFAGAARELASFRKRREGSGICAVIAARPGHLRNALVLDELRRGFDQVIGWVIDSFWVEQIPTRLCRQHYDRIFVTDPDDVEPWRDAVGLEIGCLPWGSDVLRLGSSNGRRSVDVQRIGRMPLEWDDDSVTSASCAELGLRFAGRPDFGKDSGDNYSSLMRGYSNAKMSVSFSNRVSPAGYTHPTREYLTARWTDALACGAIVAGCPPRSSAADQLLWPGATLDLESTNRSEGLHAIADAVGSWTPDRATTNFRMALERLDWRWRFRDLASAIGASTPAIDTELVELEDVVRGLT